MESPRMAAVTMAAAMVLITGTAYAMPGDGMPGMGGPGGPLGEGFLRVLLGLDLTDGQKQEAALILSKHREEGRERREALHQAMDRLRAAAEADPFDEEAVRAACKGVAAAGEEMAVHGAALAAELRGVLTPEQRASLEAHKASRQEMRERRMEKRASLVDEWIDMYSKGPR